MTSHHELTITTYPQQTALSVAPKIRSILGTLAARPDAQHALWLAQCLEHDGFILLTAHDNGRPTGLMTAWTRGGSLRVGLTVFTGTPAERWRSAAALFEVIEGLFPAIQPGTDDGISSTVGICQLGDSITPEKSLSFQPHSENDSDKPPVRSHPWLEQSRVSANGMARSSGIGQEQLSM